MKEKEKAAEDEEINKLLMDMMHGYSDSVIPPLSQISTFLHEKQIGNVSSKCMHESERRGMVENFNVLNNMIPHSFPKATRERIVEGTIQYIKMLEEDIRSLEELKNKNDVMLAQASSTPKRPLNYSVCLSVSGNVALFGIELRAERSLVTKIFMVFEKHKAEVLAANVIVNHGYLKVTVTALVNGNGNNEDTVEEIKRDIQDIVYI